MKIVLQIEWEATDATDPRNPRETRIKPGIHEMERIPDPLSPQKVDGDDWLVLKGTKIGASEASWRKWVPGQTYDDPQSPNFGQVIDWEEYTVIIEE